MVISTGGACSAPSGGLLNQHLTDHTTPPPPSNSPTSAAGPTPSRLFSLFEECVANGVWASLETFTRRGEVCVDFSCRVRARAAPRTASNRNVERTKQWRESRQQRRRHSPPIPSTETAAPPASVAVNVSAQATSTPAAARSFAEVAANPARGQKKTAAAKTVIPATDAAAGIKGRAAKSVHPKKVAKTALAASRVSQRSAILSKKRAAAASLPATSADDYEAAPELLRGREGETRLDSTLEISLAASSPPPPPPVSPLSSSSPPSSPLSYHNPCDCPTPCKERDFHDETWERGVRLNTRDPHWERVFPHFRSLRRCRFCKEPLPSGSDSGDDSGDDSNDKCQDCEELTVFCLVKKFAPRWRYPTS
jgi:hypothetical protein